MLIDKKPDVFPHPDLCMSYLDNSICRFIDVNECILYNNQRLCINDEGVVDVERNVIVFEHIKLPECQKLYKKADMKRHLKERKLNRIKKRFDKQTEAHLLNWY